MALIRALNSGVSGLKSFQTKMDTIGNNIANVETAGFKSSRVSFGELMNQNIRRSDGNASTSPQITNQVGLGVRVTSINRDFTQGVMQATGKNTDLAVEGQGFFVVNDHSESFLTRAGNFDFNQNGQLVDQGGRFVQGYMADRDGSVTAGGPTANIEIDFDKSLPPEFTSEVLLTGNLTGEKGETQVMTTTVYDNLGNAYSLLMEFTRAGTVELDNGEEASKWDLKITSPDQEGLIEEEMTVLFDTNGKVIPTESGYEFSVAVDELVESVEGIVNATGSNIIQSGEIEAVDATGSTTVDGNTLTADAETNEDQDYNDLVIEFINEGDEGLDVSYGSDRITVNLGGNNNVEWSDIEDQITGLPSEDGYDFSDISFDLDGEDFDDIDAAVWADADPIQFSGGVIEDKGMLSATAVTNENQDYNDLVIKFEEDDSSEDIVVSTDGDVMTVTIGTDNDAEHSAEDVQDAIRDAADWDDYVTDDISLSIEGVDFDQDIPASDWAAAADIQFSGGQLPQEPQQGEYSFSIDKAFEDGETIDVNGHTYTYQSDGGGDFTGDTVEDQVASLVQAIQGDGDFDAFDADVSGNVITLTETAYPPEGEAPTVTTSGNYNPDSLNNLAFTPPQESGANDFTFDLKLGDQDQGVSFTQYSGSNTTKVLSQNGAAQGQLLDINIDSDGRLQGVYDNGQTQTLAQIALAQVQNENGLEMTGSGLFRASSAAGEVFINSAEALSDTTINSGSLEGSNVDLAQEFTEMITSQRAYQSNAKVITTADEMLMEAVNLKR